MDLVLFSAFINHRIVALTVAVGCRLVVKCVRPGVVAMLVDDLDWGLGGCGWNVESKVRSIVLIIGRLCIGKIELTLPFETCFRK